MIIKCGKRTFKSLLTFSFHEDTPKSDSDWLLKIRSRLLFKQYIRMVQSQRDRVKLPAS